MNFGDNNNVDWSASIGPCPLCRSSEYRETSSGHLICINGHQSQAFREECGDDFEPAIGLSFGRRTRQSQVQALYDLSKTDNVAANLKSNSVVKIGQVNRFTLMEAFQVVLKAQTYSLCRVLVVNNASKLVTLAYRFQTMHSFIDFRCTQFLAAVHNCYQDPI